MMDAYKGGPEKEDPEAFRFYNTPPFQASADQGLPADLKDFYVIAVVSNPVRFETRYRLFMDFLNHMRRTFPRFKTNLMVVELQQGERPFAITPSVGCRFLQLRSREELWFKERMITLGIRQLPIDWKQVCWIDGDIQFNREDWAKETWHQLQTYDVVQMFSQCIDLGPKGEPIQTHNSFMWSYHENQCQPPEGVGQNGGYGSNPKRGFWHPGYAWAATRKAIDAGGLIDWAILGSGDHHMAHGLLGYIDRSYPGGVSERYKDELLDWQARMQAGINQNVGYVPGTILHSFHGKKADRKYQERWSIITDNDFDPDDDIFPDAQGLWKLDPSKPRLRDQIRLYMRQRNEDSVDL